MHENRLEPSASCHLISCPVVLPAEAAQRHLTSWAQKTRTLPLLGFASCTSLLLECCFFRAQLITCLCARSDIL